MAEWHARWERIGRAAAGIGDVEAMNLARDLDAVERRLASGEYREADFLVRSVFEVPRRTHEFVTYVKGWSAQARRWARLLAKVGVGHDQILELAPGWAPKIPLALAELGFEGRLRVRDRSAQALGLLTDFCEALRIPVRVDVEQGDLRTAPARRAPLVVANHVVDDLLLDGYARARGLDLDAIYDDEAALVAAWRAIGAGAVDVDAAADEVARVLATHVAPGGCLVVAHYPSLVERLLGDDNATRVFQRAFEGTRAGLREAGHVALEHVDGEAEAQFGRGAVSVTRAP